MCINASPESQVNINNIQLDYVENFTYLGSIISKDNTAQKDIKSRLGKARNSFAILRPIWKSNQYTLKTKMKIFNSNVKSVLLYASECWRIIQSDLKKIEGCIRKICRIFWPNKISNEELFKKTGCCNISLEIKKRRLRWLGHVL